MRIRWTFFGSSAALLAAFVLLAWPRLGEGAPPPKSDTVKLAKDTLPLFQTSDRCFACHNGLQTPSGEDYSIAPDWRASMMANSGRDPYWQAGVRRETIDHPESKGAIEDECAICHMPMMRYESKVQGKKAEVFAHLPFDMDNHEDKLAADGVSCSLCHQITKEKLGTPESYVGGFVIDTAKLSGQKTVFGPFKIDDGHQRIMRTSSDGFKPTEGDQIRSSELCATCHTLITKALGPDGKEIGSLPEQVPYQEWVHSDFKDNQSCQSCHMPMVEGDAFITGVLGKKRQGVSRHVFVGANFFLQRILNKNRADLGVWATSRELSDAADRTVAYLQTKAATLQIQNVNLTAGRLEADLRVVNLGGHKFPTAYPARRLWLHVTARDRNNQVVFESGALNRDGSIVGNDNDRDALKFEPHYQEIVSQDQVQIYESIMGDSNNQPTTGLLNALRFIKDNRLLPKGFNKATADAQIAVVGEALKDPDFGGDGDTVRYSMNVANAQGPFTIEAELKYQPVGYRWAHNLEKYDAMEPKRFVGYYEAMSDTSAITVLSASAKK